MSSLEDTWNLIVEGYMQICQAAGIIISEDHTYQSYLLFKIGKDQSHIIVAGTTTGMEVRENNGDTQITLFIKPIRVEGTWFRTLLYSQKHGRWFLTEELNVDSLVGSDAEIERIEFA